MADDASPHILLVDDDLRLRGLLETYLRREGFEVSVAGNAEQMERILRDFPVALMVLDLMLPGRGGLDICRELRAAQNSLPVIMLTAKGDDIDRILGLELGADDYLPKPCNPRELVARIRAVLRRRQTAPPGAPISDAMPVDFGPFRLHPSSRVLEKDGKRFLRHASKEPYERVVDEPLEKFFARNMAYLKWPVDGFALFQIDTPADRIAALTAPAP